MDTPREPEAVYRYLRSLGNKVNYHGRTIDPDKRYLQMVDKNWVSHNTAYQLYLSQWSQKLHTQLRYFFIDDIKSVVIGYIISL